MMLLQSVVVHRLNEGGLVCVKGEAEDGAGQSREELRRGEASAARFGIVLGIRHVETVGHVVVMYCTL